MKQKYDWKQSKWYFVLINLVAAVVVGIIAVLILIVSLRRATEHGVEVVVPDITGLYIEEATLTLAADNLRLQVIDSTYSTKTPLGTIVEQNPSAGALVKHNRIVYVVRNAQSRRPIVLPELRDLSLRQANTLTKALGLTVARVQYEPSTYRDIIIDVRSEDNTSLSAGHCLDESSSIILVVGKGQGTSEVTVPSVIGKSLSDARSWLLGNMLGVGIIEYDTEPTEETKDQYVVYGQSPESGTIVVEGTDVNIKLSIDVEKTITADNEDNEEDFF
jgi:beta-lactam-binding protein with PASTA domain